MSTVAQILRAKPSNVVHTTAPDSTVISEQRFIIEQLEHYIAGDL